MFWEPKLICDNFNNIVTENLKKQSEKKDCFQWQMHEENNEIRVTPKK
jgi:hypothetical protein